MAKLLRRLLAALIAMVIVTYIIVSPAVCTFLYRDKLLRPQVGRGSSAVFAPIAGVQDQELWIPAADGSLLHARFFRKAGGNRVLLYNIGSAGDINQRLPYVRSLLDNNISVFIYEYRGYGISQGTSTSLMSLCQDGLTAYDYLRKSEHYQPQQIVILGESLGSGVATYVSQHRGVAGIIIQSGLYSLERTAKERVPFLRIYPGFLFPRPPFNNEAILKGKHAPLLIMHGSKDNLVPINEAEDLAAKAAGPKTFVAFPNSDHYGLSPSDRALFRRTIGRFLSSLP